MLVLSRKVGERVVIGDGIVVIVKRVSGQRVTFGIEAPHDVKIIRGELEPFDKPPTPAPAPLSTNSNGNALVAHFGDEAMHSMQVKPR
jgi:carbon storage regulator